MPQHPPFTKENAADFARRAHAARAVNKANALSAAKNPQLATNGEQDFPAQMLVRLRAQLRKLAVITDMELNKLGKADAQRLSWLATATERWWGVEFSLAGRPKPANYRTTPPAKSPDAVAAPAFSLPAPAEPAKESILPAGTVPTGDPGRGEG